MSTIKNTPSDEEKISFPIWIPTLYDEKNKMTDYNILQKIEKKTLFIFNDNLDSFPHSVIKGSGNACVRNLRKCIPPRSVGIPTGIGKRGFLSLTPMIKLAIDLSFSEIDWLISTKYFDKIRYCRHKDDYLSLDNNIYKTSRDVMDYIKQKFKCRVIINSIM